MVRKRAKHRGQVLVEFSLAAVGIVALAFVAARVGQWMNASLVERNDNYQGTRIAAATSNSNVVFDAPSRIHLIGPAPEATTGGIGPIGGSNYDAGDCSADALNLLNQAEWNRNEVDRLRLEAGNIYQDIIDLHERAEELTWFADSAWYDKLRVEALDTQIGIQETKIRNLYNANFAVLNPFLTDNGIGSADELINAWKEVDDHLAWLNTEIPNVQADITDAQNRLTQINNIISGPGGINDQISDAQNRINAINTIIGGVGGLNQQIRSTQDYIDDINYELNINAEDPKFPGDSLYDIIDTYQTAIDTLRPFCDILKMPFACNTILQLENAQRPYIQRKDQLEFNRDDKWYLVDGEGALADRWVQGLDGKKTQLELVKGALESERDDQWYFVDGEGALADRWVQGLDAQKTRLEQVRDALEFERDSDWYFVDQRGVLFDIPWVQGLQNVINRLNQVLQILVDQRTVLNKVNTSQAAIDVYESEKQAIKNKWCAETDEGVQKARSDCGLNCTGSRPGGALTEPNVSAWRATLKDLSAKLTCMAHNLRDQAELKYDSTQGDPGANDLIQDVLIPDIAERIRELLAEAEELEEQARIICQSESL